MSSPSDPARTGAADAAYRDFWAEVGRSFPDLGRARSTRLYRDDEERLLREHLPGLAGTRLLKTDLWDEAKNTRILCWAAAEGAVAFGVDLSPPVVRAARAQAPPGALRVAVADIRRLPFADRSFDAIYSMGTVEHFPDPETALAEMTRVLRPGGRAIVGVPNRHDPFLRPLLVALLQALGLYAYGDERSFSRRGLRALLEDAGLEVVAETGILFLPGWLRIADLACDRWVPPLSRLTALAVEPFAWLARSFPRLRRHGYLLASVGVRPMAPLRPDRDRDRRVLP